MKSLLARLNHALLADHDASDADVERLFSGKHAYLDVACMYCRAPLRIKPVLESRDEGYWIEEAQ